MALVGFKIRSYEGHYLYFCPFCQEAYAVGELCEHFLFSVNDEVPYFSDDPVEIEEWKRERKKYEKALSDLDELWMSGKISWEEYSKRRREIEEELERVFLEKIVKPREPNKKCFSLHLVKMDPVAPGLFLKHERMIELNPPLSFKDASEIIDFLVKEFGLPKPSKIKRVYSFPGYYEGVGLETIELVDVEIPGIIKNFAPRYFVDIYYTVEEEEQEKTEREEKESG